MIIESNDDFVNTFKILISNSTNIKMSTGYFSSDIFDIFYDEFNKFKNNNGLLKVIIGADTNIEELSLLKKIEELSEDEVSEKIYKLYFKNISNLSNETLQMLLALFQKKQIEIKVGFSQNGGIYHSKYYIFENEKNNCIINGSLNLTYCGLYKNHEVIHLYKNSIDFPTYNKLFYKAWNNIALNVRCESLANIVINKISQELQLRGCVPIEITNDSIKLRDYQQEAINKLLDYNMNGFLKMATGTGKTLTTIYALKKFKELNNQYLNVHIVVPYTHLVSQWQNTIVNIFPKSSILECHSSKNLWIEKYNNTRHESMINDCFSLFVDKSYNKNRNTIKYSITSNTILVVDEAHNLTKSNLGDMETMKYKHKIGLSATPEHYIFEERTKALFEYFKGVIFKYDLSEAIKNKYLTKYNYYPMMINLKTQEIEEYKKLDLKIKNNNDKNEILKLLEERNYLLSSATGKIIRLQKELEQRELDKSLIYCNPGSVRGTTMSYIEYIASAIKEVRPRDHLEKITAEESKEYRLEIVKRLERGSTDAILAIRCLDEGFDIPVVKEAYILSSTRNPKEYIQRRGRVLRKYPGKTITNIYDFIVAIDGEILKEEKFRFDEYARLASNQNEVNKFIEENRWENHE